MWRGWVTRWRTGAALVLFACVGVGLLVDASGATSRECDDGDSCAAAVADLTTSLGVDRALVGMKAHAIAAGDVNGDGWIDVFVGTFADRPAADYAFGGATDRARIAS